mmetsp:Transcript_34064/g.95902  ORF Transcript_34064/g.95902 Transcript_34064/m.95902 type:complete len:257 (-) Transcript_34064:52-822(-)
MEKNLRVVVTSVLVRDPNCTMVRKMKSCPTAPHRQNVMMSFRAWGWVEQKEMISPPAELRPKVYVPTKMAHQKFIQHIIWNAVVPVYLRLISSWYELVYPSKLRLMMQSPYPRSMLGSASFPCALELPCRLNRLSPTAMIPAHAYSRTLYRVPDTRVLPTITVTILQLFTSTWALKGMFFSAMIPSAGPTAFVKDGLRYSSTGGDLSFGPLAPGNKNSTMAATTQHPKLCRPCRDLSWVNRAPSGAYSRVDTASCT